jgi:hypothetical protein
MMIGYTPDFFNFVDAFSSLFPLSFFVCMFLLVVWCVRKILHLSFVSFSISPFYELPPRPRPLT